MAPVHAVKGNNDGPDVEAPETLELTLGGLRVAMIHDSGPAQGRLGPGCGPDSPKRIWSCAATRIPMDDGADGRRIFNPGSPTDKRRRPTARWASCTSRTANSWKRRSSPIS